MMDLFKEVQTAQKHLQNLIVTTPLIENQNLSTKYKSTILLKREDLQTLHSFQIRGTFNKIASLSNAEKKRGIISSSAGDHAQCIAFSCSFLKVRSRIYVPRNTPKQKIKKLQQLGKNYIETLNAGDFINQTLAIAVGDASIHHKAFIHSCNDLKVIAGLGTLGTEILFQNQSPIDFVFLPFENPGLAAGLSTVFKHLSPTTKIIGVATQGFPLTSFENKNGIMPDPLHKFEHGTFSKKTTDMALEICRKNKIDVIQISEGQVCTSLLQLHKEEGITLQLNGVSSIAVLDTYASEIEGKKVVCILSGGRKKIKTEYQIAERSLQFRGLIHYLIIKFPKPGGLKEFINTILSPEDDLTYFKTFKNNNIDNESVLVRLELKNPANILSIKAKMLRKGFQYQNLNDMDQTKKIMSSILKP